MVSVILVIGCSKETLSEVEKGFGDVMFECSVVPSIGEQVVSKAGGQRILPDNCIPVPENLQLQLSNSAGLVASYGQMADYDQPLLTAGDYKATFFYGNPEEEGAEACYFTGETDFSIVARKTITRQVSVALANAVYSLDFTEWFRKYYTTYNITISTESGNQSAFSSPSTTTAPIFVKAATKLYLSGTATKTNGVKVEFPRTEIGTTAARTWHTISIDASQAGQAGIVVSLNDTPIDIQEISVEMNPDA